MSAETPTRRSLADQWEEFARYVFRVPVSDAQRSDMQRAFYAGAYVMTAYIQAVADEPDDERAGVEHLSKVCREAGKFFQDLKTSPTVLESPPETSP